MRGRYFALLQGLPEPQTQSIGGDRWRLTLIFSGVWSIKK